MREILFRGYSKEDEQWHYGSLMHTVEGYFVMPIEDGDLYPVEEESIGQYTGFTDKNGNEIFEGDVINWDVDYYGFIEYWEDRFRIVPETLDMTDYLLKDISTICDIVSNQYEDLRFLKNNAVAAG